MAEPPSTASVSFKPPRKTADPKPKPTKQGGPANQKPSSKLRGLERDSPEVRVSKTLSWLLRHGAQSEGLSMRPDGYVKVTDLVRVSICDRMDCNRL